MGQVPAKYFYPSAPYGGSDANALMQVSPAAVNPQQPLLPDTFTNPGPATQTTQTALGGVGNPILSGLGGSGGRFLPNIRSLLVK